MRILFRRSTCSITIIFAILACCSLQAQPAQAQAAEKPCGETVRSFYDWYAPRALRRSATPAWAIAAKEKGNAFSSELSQLLREDSEAQAKAVGDIVGLDFAPFLYTQDPAARNALGKITTQGESSLVQVGRPRQKIEKPVVTAESVYRHDQ